MASLSSLPQDNTRPGLNTPKQKLTPKPKKKQHQQHQQQQTSKHNNVNNNFSYRGGNGGYAMQGNIDLKTVIFWGVIPAIIYTVVIVSILNEPCTKNMPSCKLMDTNDFKSSVKVKVDIRNKVANKLKTFMRRVTKNKKKNKKKKKCPKKEGEPSFKMREDPVGEMERYNQAKH